jgi:hypothetical protein
MACCGTRHRALDESGRGLCSVPMWNGFGHEAGFCDEEAYGRRPECKIYQNAWTGEPFREDGKFSGYVPGLACYRHGGPNERVFKDGPMWCAVYKDFTNLQESDAGFGETEEMARQDLIKRGRG